MNVHKTETEHANSKNIDSLPVKVLSGKVDSEAKQCFHPSCPPPPTPWTRLFWDVGHHKAGKKTELLPDIPWTLRKLMVASRGRRGGKAELLSLWDPAQHQIKPTSTCYVYSICAKLKFTEEGIFIRLLCIVLQNAFCWQRETFKWEIPFEESVNFLGSCFPEWWHKKWPWLSVGSKAMTLRSQRSLSPSHKILFRNSPGIITNDQQASLEELNSLGFYL